MIGRITRAQAIYQLDWCVTRTEQYNVDTSSCVLLLAVACGLHRFHCLQIADRLVYVTVHHNNRYMMSHASFSLKEYLLMLMYTKYGDWQIINLVHMSKRVLYAHRTCFDWTTIVAMHTKDIGIEREAESQTEKERENPCIERRIHTSEKKRSLLNLSAMFC